MLREAQAILLLAGQVQLSSTSLAVLIPASMIVSGAVLLVGFYFVHRRFITVEFPGYVNRMEERLGTLVTSTEKMEETITRLLVLMEKHESRMDFHEWRIDRLERANEVEGGKKGQG